MIQVENRGQKAIKLVGGVVVLTLVAGAALGGIVPSIGFGNESESNPVTSTAGPATATPMPTLSTTSTQTLSATQTSTFTPTPTTIATPNSTPISTPSPSEGNFYTNFLVEMDGGLNLSIRTPLRIRGVTIQESVLYLVHNATSAEVNTTQKYVEWGDIAVAYAGAIRDTKKFYNNSKVPTRMVVFEANSSNLAAEPGKFEVTTENSKAWNTDEITNREFAKRWQDTLERQDLKDEKFAKIIDQEKRNTTYYLDKPADVEGE